MVSRRWSRIPFKHLQPSHARYAKFLERVGVLTRPAIGGSWYVAFQGLSGEYAFMVSAGVKSLAFVPAFYSSAVSLVRGNGGSAAEAAEVSIHFSFCYSRAFGPGDTVHVHLPGFFIGGLVDLRGFALFAGFSSSIGVAEPPGQRSLRCCFHLCADTIHQCACG